MFCLVRSTFDYLVSTEYFAGFLALTQEMVRSGHGSGQTLVCLRCDKILKTENRKPGTFRPNKVPSIFDPAAKSKMTKNEAYMHLNKRRELDNQGRIRDRKAMRNASRGMDLRRAKIGTVKGWSSTDIMRKSRKSRRA